MAQAVSISLSKFVASVQAAVKAAAAKHPKFRVDVPSAVTVSYLIRGIPVPDGILSTVTMSETQAFATDVTTHIAGAHPEALGPALRGAAQDGAILSVGRHVIVGIPPVPQVLQIEKWPEVPLSKLCPSAQPGMNQCTVLGVVQREGSSPMLDYLREPLPATPEILAMAAPLKPTEVFRLAATTPQASLRCLEEQEERDYGFILILGRRMFRLPKQGSLFTYFGREVRRA